MAKLICCILSQSLQLLLSYCHYSSIRPIDEGNEVTVGVTVSVSVSEKVTHFRRRSLVAVRSFLANSSSAFSNCFISATFA